MACVSTSGQVLLALLSCLCACQCAGDTVEGAGLDWTGGGGSSRATGGERLKQPERVIKGDRLEKHS